MFDLDLGTPSSGPFKDGEPNVKEPLRYCAEMSASATERIHK